MKYLIVECEKIDLHDFELGKLEVDYFSKIVEVFLTNDKNEKYIRKFNRFYFFSINCFEPWGEGMYINSFRPIENQCDMGKEGLYEIVLNSGDKLNFQCKEVVLEKIVDEMM